MITPPRRNCGAAQVFGNDFWVFMLRRMHAAATRFDAGLPRRTHGGVQDAEDGAPTRARAR